MHLATGEDFFCCPLPKGKKVNKSTEAFFCWHGSGGQNTAHRQDLAHQVILSGLWVPPWRRIVQPATALLKAGTEALAQLWLLGCQLLLSSLPRLPSPKAGGAGERKFLPSKTFALGESQSAADPGRAGAHFVLPRVAGIETWAGAYALGREPRVIQAWLGPAMCHHVQLARIVGLMDGLLPIRGPQDPHQQVSEGRGFKFGAGFVSQQGDKDGAKFKTVTFTFASL